MMKSTVVLLVTLLLSACGAKDIATLKAKPAIHRIVEAQGDYHEVHERIMAKILECGNPGQYSQPFFENKALGIIEVPIGTREGLAFYYSIKDNGNGTSLVNIYSQFKISAWAKFTEMIERGASGQPGCP